MENIKGFTKCGKYSFDTDNIICPICGNYTELYQIEGQTGQDDIVNTEKYFGEHIVTAITRIDEIPIAMHCQHCGTEIRIPSAFHSITRFDREELAIEDLQLAFKH